MKSRNNASDHLVRRPPFLDNKKKSILNSRRIEIFLKGLAQDFGQKLEITFWLLNKMDLTKC